MQRQLREDGATARSSAKERPERKQAACCQSAVLNFRQCGFETLLTQKHSATRLQEEFVGMKGIENTYKAVESDDGER
jgi:hypothetical protein